MAEGVLMPKAGITVEQCLITKWEKAVGDHVNIGDVLFAYETDKAVFECESTAEGELLAIFFEEGDEVPVLVNVCAIGMHGDSTEELRPTVAVVNTAEAGQSSASTEVAATPTQPVTATQTAATALSPRAKNLAERAGVNPSAAVPTGPYGRIIERDIRAVMLNQNDLQPASGTEPLLNDERVGAYTDMQFSKIRSAIAAAMSRSLTECAQLTHHHTFDATAILNLRKQLKAAQSGEERPNITLNDMVLYAVSRVLPLHTSLNAHLLDGSVLRQFDNVHLGIAVDTPRGLMVPTLFDANKKSLEQIAIETKELAALAQSGTINPDLLRGATFTVSNLGALGVEMFTPVINPPQVAILGVCNIVTRLRQTDDGYAPYPAMGLSVTYDHRAVDGAPEARFAAALAQYLENFSQRITEE